MIKYPINWYKYLKKNLISVDNHYDTDITDTTLGFIGKIWIKRFGSLKIWIKRNGSLIRYCFFSCWLS